MVQIKKEIFFEEAESAHAVAFIDFMNQVAGETDFLVMDETGFRFTSDELAAIFDNSLGSPNQLHLLAVCGDEVIGAVTVRASNQYRISHVGNIFIAVRKDYWGHGIGQLLLQEVVEWARSNGIIKRLELTVQIRNSRAVSLYQKLGFAIEGTQKWGARTDEGEWLDLYYMGKLIDDK
ncbi:MULTISPECIES: GNAT family N-acetyltransferase [unclassified Streptococcus]|uniref:GNAT family N-acetyltransferase n=1 Tax=unclassified Streptococcus TaxID=2608887 RepID=UPI001072A01B|nr:MULTISPECIES: GNAT family N-acetyltransferase [unclassified Streptococcus]MBF0787687.1 GNAT family N-acetyltransferase [Streptococcus sp. 19428wC2_LYSM12]MCQ9211242.1 GNAT family N-acetyltransferase [Streptococcus sp. B01]MCQ9214555.1 GNAT family N-acetyltransferase [Streptococcus sp. O1]TFV05296.1 GNAT family N-acetyltransferase [Streptococcus sp. LYSM12]